MKCPVCAEQDLVMSERQGIEIDYCPKCRGVWLDRGELDKIIERSASMADPAPAPGDRGDRRAEYHPKHDSYYKHHKKKKHWLMELFD